MHLLFDLLTTQSHIYHLIIISHKQSKAESVLDQWNTVSEPILKIPCGVFLETNKTNIKFTLHCAKTFLFIIILIIIIILELPGEGYWFCSVCRQVLLTKLWRAAHTAELQPLQLEISRQKTCLAVSVLVLGNLKEIENNSMVSEMWMVWHEDFAHDLYESQSRGHDSDRDIRWENIIAYSRWYQQGPYVGQWPT